MPSVASSKCTKIVGSWGFTPDPTGGAYCLPPDLLAGFKGPTSKWRGREGRGRQNDLCSRALETLMPPLIVAGGLGIVNVVLPGL